MSITASWQFTGAVTLEVSADNGQTYAPIINGVPLASGFGKGSDLKWRVTLGANSEVTEVKIAYTDSSGVIGSFGQPHLSGFTRRKKLTIVNPSMESVFNYQLRVLVAESLGSEVYDIHLSSDMEADFKDVRFVCADGQTILAHYLENIDESTSNRVATFWVKIPQIPPQGTEIYLYYGNVLAEDISSAQEVFDFYDDFEGNELDQEKWELQEGVHLISESQLRLSAAGVLTREFAMNDGIVEYRATPQTGDEVWVILRGQAVTINTANQAAYSSAYEGAEHCIAIGDFVKANEASAIVAGVTYDYLAILKGPSLTFHRYTEGFSSLEAEVTYDDVGGLSSGKIGLKSGDGCVTNFDWIRVRKINSYGVKIDRAAAESAISEYVTLPIFDGLILTGSDNLTLKDELDEGTYVSQELSLAEPARIFTPYWKALDAEEGQVLLDVSLDGGGDYLGTCLEGTAYYASKGDFFAGDDLKLRITLLRRGFSIPQLEELGIEYGPGKILLITPNGAEVWQAGTQKTISWTAQEYEKTYPMKLSYSLDGGETYELIAENIANSGTYFWSIPKEVSSDKVIVKISDAIEPGVFDVSDDVFTISMEEEVIPEEKAVEELVEEPSLPGRVMSKEEAALAKLVPPTEPARKELYDVLVKLGDNYNPDPEIDARGCFKHGDVVMVKPAGFDWSETERNSFLIVQLNLTPQEARELTSPKKIAAGKSDKSERPAMKTLKRRAKRIDLAKLGLSKAEMKMGKRKLKLRQIQNNLKSRALKKGEVIKDK